MDTQELANALFGASRIENTSPKTMTTLQGVAVSDSVDGIVKVKLLNAESVPEEADATEENTVVELLTTPAVKEGDTVVVTAEGGVLKTMSVTGNYGSGDKQTADTEEAKKVATNYIDIDENKGITVGNMQDKTLGHNTYIDANGVSIREGETVLASFEDDEIALGKNNQTAQITFCGGLGLLGYSADEGVYVSSNGIIEDEFNNSINLKVGTKEYGTQQNYTTLLQLSKDNTFNTTCLSRIGVKQFQETKIDASSTEITLTALFHQSVQQITNQKILKVNTTGVYIDDATVLSETTLYSDATGTTGDVTLSECITGFTYLEIYYNDGDVYSSEKVNVADVTRMIVELSNSSNEVEGVVVADATITRGADTPVYSITRVVGIK